MNLDNYLKRIGYSGSKTINRSSLDALMTAHVNAVTFENLNQQLGVPITMELADAYEKVVNQRRGGWCFELNSLFGWALRELGFDVITLAGQVGRTDEDTGFLTNHMLLRVNLEEPLLVDVGYGCGLARSIPLAPNAQLQRPYDVSITALDGSFLRYGEQVRSVSGSYDFTLEPVERSYFDAACHRLQTDAASPFLRTLTAQQRRGDDHLVLRGLVLKTIGRDATQELVLQSKEELVHCLRSTFGLEVPSVADIWPKLKHRHDELFNSD